MKKIKLIELVAAVAIMCCFVSCNNATKVKEADAATASVTDTTPAPAPATPAAVAKPANTLLIWHKVANFDMWLAAYEAHDSARLANGLHNYIIGRDAGNPNLVLVALQIDDVEKAKAFGASQDLKAAMQKAGVTGTPAISYLDVQMLDTTTNASTTRLMVSHKVKDWDAWKKAFDSHKQVRLDAGLIDRAVGYEIGNKNQVTVVCAVIDAAKAKAFINSKEVKDRMAEAGVEGPPTIHFYTVAKKW